MQKIQIPFTLPSQGKLYEKFDGNVLISPIRGSQEEILAGAGDGINRNIMLRQVTQQLVTLPPEFKFYDLLFTDWVACLVQILAASYSPSIPLSPICPSCKHTFSKIISINDLDLRTAEFYTGSPATKEYTEPFSADLPLSKDKIEFKLNRLSAVQQIEDYVVRMKKMGSNHVASNYSIAMQIVSINGVKAKLQDSVQWAVEAIAGDLSFLRNAIEEKETGYDLTIKFLCPQCGYSFALQMPLDGSFFRGTNA